MRRLVLAHRRGSCSVHRDRAREHEALDVVADRFVDQVHAADHIVRVVEPADEMGQSLRGVRGEMVHVLESMLCEERREQIVICDAAVHELHIGWNILFESAG